MKHYTRKAGHICTSGQKETYDEDTFSKEG